MLIYLSLLKNTSLIIQVVLVNGRCDLKHVCSFGRGLLDLAEENENTLVTLAEVNFRLCYTLNMIG